MEFSKAIEELGISNLQRLSLKEKEILYAAAYGMYRVNDLAKAAGIFTYLLSQFPFEQRFWKGLAATRQMQKEYRSALRAWGAFALLSSHDRDAHFHAAECYLSLGEIEEAKKALACAKHFDKSSHPKMQALEERLHA